ncbi:Aldehyde dehydrogenase family 3 member I1 [Carex littledalei]|uniref:Aldehyde dehydrogenase family 3 member I1 n=1 Tax=Carex littledalei TaxID=544730 RepID=A0A833QZ70_9POAL|nr:Aldehyde dehydrogenase family 3 member I1 [Carex littledalei]
MHLNHISSHSTAGWLQLFPTIYTSHHIIHRNHVLGSASMRHQHLVWDGSRSGISKSYQARPIKSSSVEPTCSQDRGRAENPIQSRNVEPSSTGQRRSVGVAGPNFREKLRRFLAIKNAHISGLEDRIQTLERKNGDTLLDVWKFNLMSIEPTIGAIVAGNVVVLKPSEIAPATSEVDSCCIKVLQSTWIAVAQKQYKGVCT